MRIEDRKDWALTKEQRIQRYKKDKRRDPYGTRPGEEPILEVILRMGREGNRPFMIAQHLNETGVLSRGAVWHDITVKRILQRHGISEWGIRQ